jgi:hypothetical protein
MGLIRNLKEAVKKTINQNKPVVFISEFSYEPVSGEHFKNIIDTLSKYGKEHGIDIAVFNNTLVAPVEREQLKALFDVVYKNKFT